MIRVRISSDVVCNILQQGAEYDNLKVTQGIPPSSVLIDVDWDDQTNIVSLIFDIGDGNDDIDETGVVVSTGSRIQTPLF